MSRDTSESGECDGFVVIGDQHPQKLGSIPKKELESVIHDKVDFKLQVDWFKDWYALLTDPKMTRKRREKDVPWPTVSDDLSKEEKRKIEYFQDGFKRLWQWMQSHTVLVKQIHRLFQTCTNEQDVPPCSNNISYQNHVRKHNDSTEQKGKKSDGKDYLDEMTDAMTKLRDIEKIFLDRKPSSLEKQIFNLEEELEKVHKEVKQATIEKENALTRLSQLASDRLKADNSAITDLSDLYRPTNLADGFNELYDNEWTDAFDYLTTEEGKGEEDAINCLLDVLMDVYNSCKERAGTQRTDIQNAIYLTSQYEKIPCPDRSTHDPSSVSEDFRIHNLISEFQKATTEISIPILKKNLRDNVSNSQCPMNIQHNRVSPFLIKSIELCWYMNIQEKPIELLFDTEKGCNFRTDLYRHYTKSGTSCDYLVWPAMLLYDNGPLLQKGVIQPE